MNNSALFQRGWNIRSLILGNLLALLLLAFWLWPTGHAVCTQFDEWLFAQLNQPLATSSIWRHIWMVGSLRPFDIITGLIMLSLLIKGDWVFRAVETRAAFLGFIALLVLMLVLRLIFSRVVDAQGLQHDSPTAVLPNAVHLSDLFPHLDKRWDLKDQSKQSFPGDHASVLLIWALFMNHFCRRIGQRVVVWAITLLFMTPRLVAGAHWGQDDYIGGVMMAALAMAWGFHTPFVAWASEALLRLTAPLFRLAGKLPLLGQMAIARDSLPG